MEREEAHELIAEVLQGFLSRTFPPEENEDPDRFEKHLDVYKRFVKDRSSFWTKEKTVLLIAVQNTVENTCRREGVEGTLPGCLTFIVERAWARISDEYDSQVAARTKYMLKKPVYERPEGLGAYRKRSKGTSPGGRT